MSSLLDPPPDKMATTTHNAEGGLQLMAAAEEGNSGEDDEAETGTRHGNHQTSHISEVAHKAGAHQREDDVIILLPLETINSAHLQGGTHDTSSDAVIATPRGQSHQGGKTKRRVVSTSLVENIANKVLLAIVGREDGNLLRGITL